MFQITNKVTYSELDEKGQMSLGALLNQFQNCSTFHSESIGLGLESLKSRQRAWILSAWQIGLNELPRLGDGISTATWATGFQGLYGIRNFSMRTLSGELLAWANSVWVFMDLAAGRPTRPAQEEMDGYEVEEPLPFEFAPRKITTAGEGIPVDSFPVRRYHLDTNMHVNNGQYIQMAREYLPDDFGLTQVRAEYRKSAMLGDQLLAKVCAGKDLYTVTLNSETGEIFAVIEFKK